MPPQLLDGAGWVCGRGVRSLRRYDGAKRGQAARHSGGAGGTVASVGFVIESYAIVWFVCSYVCFERAKNVLINGIMPENEIQGLSIIQQPHQWAWGGHGWFWMCEVARVCVVAFFVGLYG